jgi:site-specific DNA-cytosine methylase
MKNILKKVKKMQVLGVAAGQGALLFPFRRKLIANIEPRGVFHTSKEEQWKLNFGNVPFIKGYDLNPEWKPDIILSSPDCGASSIMRLSKVKELGNPEKNQSINLVLKAIKFYTPKIFLIENLPRLLTLMPKDFFEETLNEYQLVFHESSVAEFGNSQVSRKRLMIIGVHKCKGKSFLNSFNNKFQVNNLRSSRNLLEAAFGSNYMPPLDKTLAMYDYRKLPNKKCLSVKAIHDLWLGDFSNEKKWPIKTAKMKTLPGVYRLEADKYPLTLRPADRQFRPDGWPLGILDFKNIMGLPDKFEIYMDEKNYNYWLNKARYTIAKGAVGEIGTWFKKSLYACAHRSRASYTQ